MFFISSVKPTIVNGEAVSNGGGNKQSADDVFKIAEKAEQLLREIFTNKQNAGAQQQQTQQQPALQFQPQLQHTVLQPYPNHVQHQVGSFAAPYVTQNVMNPYHAYAAAAQYQTYVQPSMYQNYYAQVQQPPLAHFNYQLNYPVPTRPIQHQLYAHTVNCNNYQAYNMQRPQQSFHFSQTPTHQQQHQQSYQPSKRKYTDMQGSHDQTEDDDLNIRRERELKDLKCKSIIEKMLVFIKYYQQFKDLYIQRMQTIECSDTLKSQFHSLIKYLNEYEEIINELDLMITQHERESCRNNHRKTKKFFNKTKAFIRYECSKRLQVSVRIS